MNGNAKTRKNVKPKQEEMEMKISNSFGVETSYVDDP